MRWLAVLAFVPVVAWGQSSDCYSVKTHDFFAEMAEMAEKGHEGGMSERQLLAVFHDSAPMVRAAWNEAVRHEYADGGLGLSSLIAAMQAACVREDYASRR